MSTLSLYTGDGSTTQFDITFSYDDSTTVKASVDGVATPFTFINASRIQFTTAPASGTEIRIYRETPVAIPKVDFADGAIVRADDLDAAIRQARNRVEEVGDLLSDLTARSVQVPPGESGIELPSNALRGGHLLGFEVGSGDVVLENANGGVTDAGLMTFTPEGVGAVARSVASKDRERISVLDYIPVAYHAAIQDGTTTVDVTGYINAAVAYARTTPYQEKRVIFPAGTYRASQIKVRDWSFFTLHAEGTVNIVGIDGTKKFIFGDDRYTEFGHTENYTQNFRMTGGPWLIGPLAGQSYENGLKLENVKDSRFENLSVSGTYTPAGGVGDRKAVAIELSFNNSYYNCTIGDPGAPIGADKSYGVFMGSDNCNNNRFFNLRLNGGGGTMANTVGLHIEGNGNAIYGADLSAVHTAMEMNAARGFLASSFYCEAISRAVNVTFLSTGCVFLPGHVEILANGTAYDLGSNGNIQTEGFQILGGNHKFDPTGTTLLKKGSDATHGNCYGLTFQPGIDLTYPPAVMSVGMDMGSAGATWLDAHEVAAAKITFPDTPVASANASALWSAHSGTFLFGNTLATPDGAVPKLATWQRLNKFVLIDFIFKAGASADPSTAKFTGCPFVPAGTSYPAHSPGSDQTDRDLEIVVWGANDWRIRKISTNTYQTNADIAGKIFTGTVVMFVA